MLTQDRRRARGRLANAAQRASRFPNDPAAQAARDDADRQYRVVAAEDYIRELVASAPPLTAEQRDKLAALLRGGAAA